MHMSVRLLSTTLLAIRRHWRFRPPSIRPPPCGHDRINAETPDSGGAPGSLALLRSEVRSARPVLALAPGECQPNGMRPLAEGPGIASHRRSVRRVPQVGTTM